MATMTDQQCASCPQLLARWEADTGDDCAACRAVARRPDPPPQVRRLAEAAA